MAKLKKNQLVTLVIVVGLALLFAYWVRQGQQKAAKEHGGVAVHEHGDKEHGGKEHGGKEHGGK